MKRCKFCNSAKIVKNGIARGVQRYKCNECSREQIAGDKREKYEDKQRKAAVILYLEGNGIRRIARILNQIFTINVKWQTVAQWLQKAGKIVENEIKTMERQRKEIAILEMDELYTYIKKNKIKSEYGLLLIGTDSVFVKLK